MPSLAEVHGRSGGRRSNDGAAAVGEPVSAEDAVQLTAELSATGVLLFVLGVGFAFFFDSLLGTVSYLVVLGIVVLGLVWWFLAVGPNRNRTPGRSSASRSRPRSLSRSRTSGLGSRSGVLAAVRERLRGRRQTRRRGRYGVDRRRPGLLARVRRALDSVHPSRRRVGERL